MTRFFSPVIACVFLIIPGETSIGTIDDDRTSAQRDEAYRLHGLDPLSSLETRVRDTPAAILKMFEGEGQKVPTPHVLSDEERRKLSAAFAALPPLHRRVLRERLRSVSFLDGMPNTALTSPANPGEPFRLFDITIRAGVIGEDMTQWLTGKERTLFQEDDRGRSVTVEAGHLDALIGVLLHEATHVVDFALEVTPSPYAKTPPAATEFTQGVWESDRLPAPEYRSALLGGIRFRGGQALPMDQAVPLYEALKQTPFVSVYASTNCHDDLAEFLAISHLTERLMQPFRIVVRERDRDVLVYEPMKTDLVRKRLDQMRRFYDEV